MALPLLASLQLGSKPDGQALQKQFFMGVLESIWETARRLGVDQAVMERLRSRAADEFTRVLSIFQLQETFLRCAEAVIEELSRLHAGIHSRIVERARTIIARGPRR